jgi:hypothetical protein
LHVGGLDQDGGAVAHAWLLPVDQLHLPSLDTARHIPTVHNADAPIQLWP